MKKYLPLLLLGFLFLVPQANAAPAYVSSLNGTAAVSTSCVVSNFAVTAGNLLTIKGRTNTITATTSISDTAGNTYFTSWITTSTFPGTGFEYYAIANSTANITTTILYGASNSNVCLMNQFSGTATTTPLDVSASANSGAGTLTTCNAGPITPNVSGDLVEGTCLQQSAGAFALTPGTGFTVMATTTRIGTQYLVATSTASVSSTWTIGTADQVSMGVSAFKAPQTVATVDTLFFAGD